MTIIGIIGRIGSGKTVVVDYLRRRYGIPVIRLGDIVASFASREGLPATRENLHAISRRYAERCGADFFARQAIRKASTASDAALVVTGVRTAADVVAFRNLMGHDFVLVHIETSSSEKRFDRLRRRGYERDPQTHADFIRMDAEEERRFRISEAVRYADRKICNDGSLAELYEQTESVLVQGVLARVPVSLSQADRSASSRVVTRMSDLWQSERQEDA